MQTMMVSDEDTVSLSTINIETRFNAIKSGYGAMSAEGKYRLALVMEQLKVR